MTVLIFYHMLTRCKLEIAIDIHKEAIGEDVATKAGGLVYLPHERRRRRQRGGNQTGRAAGSPMFGIVVDIDVGFGSGVRIGADTMWKPNWEGC